ncbi:MAG: UDP-N-acetylmuramyl-tripeptide synthetase [Frankiales bacterium]|nr:UDP-N-acetylmuramyl-tripeptide synthetase [Frankiales bacterium]
MPATLDDAALRPAHPTPRRLSDLLGAVAGLRAQGELGDVVVTGCTHDSRQVRAGDLYAALPGAHVHGAAFLEQAVAAGAVAVLTDAEGAKAAGSIPCVLADRPREVLGHVAAWVHGDPAAALTVVGITGTNGKTTTSFMVEAGLRASGAATGLIGTVINRIAGQDIKSSRSTPESTDLQAMFATMRERGVTAAVMEVSSEGIAQGRVNGVPFDVSLFLNLSQDHLNFHGTMEAYFQAKADLFSPARSRVGIANADDEAGQRLLREAQIPMSAFGVSAPATWTARDVELRTDGSSFRAVGPDTEVDASVRLPGDFNVSNALAALAALATAGVDPQAAARGIAELGGVPGRMEQITNDRGFAALVDFAHTPEAVQTLLASVRRVTEGRVIVVLGCGGDRDPGKRPLMGQAAVTGADIAVFTSDNPRSEDPAEILAQMGPGAVVEPDRQAAIRFAVGLARPGDTVVVAGKGHESGQEVGGVVTPFDDRLVLREALQELTP